MMQKDGERTGQGNVCLQLNQDLEIQEISQVLLQDLGFESKEALCRYGGTAFWTRLDQSQIPAFQEFLEKLQQGQKISEGFFRVRNRKGNTCWWKLSNLSLERKNGENYVRFSVLTETARETLLKSLYEEEQRIRQCKKELTGRSDDFAKDILENAGYLIPSEWMAQWLDELPCGLVLYGLSWNDTEEGFCFMNHRFSSWICRTAGELAALKGEALLQALVYSEDIPSLKSILKEVVHTEDTLSVEVRLKGEEILRWVRVFIKARRQPSGRLLLQCVLSDISHEKQWEQKISFQNYCLEQLNRSLFFGIIVKKPGLQHRPIYMSTNIQTYLNSLIPNLEQWKGEIYQQVIHPEDYAAVHAVSLRCLREGLQEYTLEFRLRMETGSYRWIKIMGKRLDDFGSDQAYLLTFFDITSVKEIQEQLRIREEEYRIAVLHSKDIIVRLQLQEGSIYVPEAVARQYRMPAKVDNMPHALIENGCILEESVPEYLRFYEEIQQGKDSAVEFRSRWFGEKVYWFRGTATVIRSEEGKAVSAVLSFSDITAQKQMAQEMQSLEESEETLGMILGSSAKLIFKYHFDTDILRPISPFAEEVLEKFPADPTPENLLKLPFVMAGHLEEAKKTMEKIRQGVPQGAVTVKVQNRDGNHRWYHCVFATAFSRDRHPLYSIISCEDITEKRRQEASDLRLQNYTTKNGARRMLFNLEYNLSNDTFEGSEGILPDGYQNGFTASYTAAFSRILEDILPRYKKSFYGSFELGNLFQAWSHGERYGTQEVELRYKGEPIWVRIFYQIFKDPYTDCLIIWISCIDIDQEKRTQLQLIQQAKLDSVTGISNRSSFQEAVAQRCEENSDGFLRALIMLDIDGFKKVNDALGYLEGDRLLKDIAVTLQMAADNRDLVARIGGDEFAVYCSDFSDIAKAKERLRIILSAVCREVGNGIPVTISAGVSIYPRDGKDFETLYEKASYALECAKRKGGNLYVIYDETMHALPRLNDVTPVEDAAEQSGIYIRTFGYFEVFYNGEPLLIKNAKAKELLALLTDRRGAYVSAGDIISCLWEDDPVSQTTLTRVRKTFMILRNTLAEKGLEGILESQQGLRRLNPKKVHCDLYQFLSRKPEYRHLYRGAYMVNYSWGEWTMDELEQEKFHS